MLDAKALIRTIFEYCEDHGIPLPLPLLSDAYKKKAAGGRRKYRASIAAAVTSLYDGDSDQAEFIQEMDALIQAQFEAAWALGAQSNDKPEDQDQGERDWLIKQEQEHVNGFASDVIAAAGLGLGAAALGALLQRADLWASMFDSIESQARIYTADDDKRFVWQRGDTEDGCDTCLTLDGVVATAADWRDLRARGIYPHSRELACHGYNCDCSMEETDEDLTEGGIPL